MDFLQSLLAVFERTTLEALEFFTHNFFMVQAFLGVKDYFIFILTHFHEKGRSNGISFIQKLRLLCCTCVAASAGSNSCSSSRKLHSPRARHVLSGTNFEVELREDHAETTGQWSGNKVDLLRGGGWWAWKSWQRSHKERINQSRRDYYLSTLHNYRLVEKHVFLFDRFERHPSPWIARICFVCDSKHVYIVYFWNSIQDAQAHVEYATKSVFLFLNFVI